MKQQNEFPGLDNEQLQMIKAGLPTGNAENEFICITGETGAGKTNTLNAVFVMLEQNERKKFIELGDNFNNDWH